MNLNNARVITRVISQPASRFAKKQVYRKLASAVNAPLTWTIRRPGAIIEELISSRFKSQAVRSNSVRG
jgi:hypothetical protein